MNKYMFFSMLYGHFFFKSDENICSNIDYIEDEAVNWELSSKSISQQSKAGKSTASVAQRNVGHVSPSVIGQHESPRIRRSSYVKPRKLRGAPKDTDIFEHHQPRMQFEENPHHQPKMSMSELSVSGSDLGMAYSSISDSSGDNYSILFGSHASIDRPILPASVAKPFPGYDRHEGGYPIAHSIFYDGYQRDYTVGRSAFYLPDLARVDYMESPVSLKSYFPSRPVRGPVLTPLLHEIHSYIFALP